MEAGKFYPPIPQPVTGWESAQLETDTPCRKCKYNLRGLATDSRCPECGTPVGFSTRGDLIRYSDPMWTDRLQTGITCILWYIVVVIVGAIVGVSMGQKGQSPPPAAVLINIGGAILYLYGAWLLTTPDPSGLGEDRYGTSRKLIRITLLVAILEHLLSFTQGSTAFPPAVTAVLGLLGGIGALFRLVGTFATLNYLGKLAARIPNHELMKRAQVLMWGIGIPLGVVIVLSLIVIMMTAGGNRSAVRDMLAGIGCIFGLCGLALIVFGIMYLLFLEKLRKQLGINADIARRTWAAEAAPPV
jgi:hypothetical protein